MSKSTGNVINPYDLVAEYSTDAVRYFLIGGLPSYEDGDFSKKLFEEHYTAKLVNGVGNLAARTATMVEKYCAGKTPSVQPDRFDTAEFWKNYEAALAAYRFDEAMRVLDRYVTSINQAIDAEAPFKKAKEGIDVSPFMYQIAEALRHIGVALLPIVPKSAEAILAGLSITPAEIMLPNDAGWGRLVPGTPVVKGAILFPRLTA